VCVWAANRGTNTSHQQPCHDFHFAVQLRQHGRRSCCGGSDEWGSYYNDGVVFEITPSGIPTSTTTALSSSPNPTLSSGAIVVLASFLTKNDVTIANDSHFWLFASVVCLITCLISSLVYFWTFGIQRQWQRPTPSAYIRPMEKMTGLVLASGFCAGILCLGVFVIKNSK
jgi:hypothetical protein